MSENIKESSEILQLVSFDIGKEEFAIEILKVQEIIKIVSITKIPNSPSFVEGVINLRGRIIPVISLRTRLGLEQKGNDKHSRIIVVEIKGKIIGFIVDSVSEVLRIPASITENPPELTTDINSQYITSIAKYEDRLIILLDIDKLLLEKEIEQIKSIEKAE